jgi:hypothetical protein
MKEIHFSTLKNPLHSRIGVTSVTALCMSLKKSGKNSRRGTPFNATTEAFYGSAKKSSQFTIEKAKRDPYSVKQLTHAK